MKLIVSAFCAAALAGATVAAQRSEVHSKQKVEVKDGRKVTVTGCVEQGPDGLVLTDVEGAGVNGRILLAADHWVGQTFDVRTVNGAIELDVPHDCSAHVELSTTLGTITTNVPVPVLGLKHGFFGRKLSFDIGDGGALIRASAVTGSIKLKRQN